MTTANSNMLCGAIEAGGTKFVCGVGTGPDDLELEVFDTMEPSVTLGRTVAFFRQQQRHRPIAAIGIGSFGPIHLNGNNAETYGAITLTTPKEDWRGINIAKIIEQQLELPVGIDTDVNAAALGEHRWGCAKDLDTFLYLTVGTGIGGGGLSNGQPMHGLTHPEMGHIRIPRDTTDPYSGGCPSHEDCLEGLASGKALEKRWGKPARSLPLDHEAWTLEANYLALALVNFICTFSPQRIVLGGGVMKQTQLFPLIRQRVRELINHYVQAPELLQAEEMQRYIVKPALGDRAGVLGAIALAQDKLNSNTA